jgi:hypothetical protein
MGTLGWPYFSGIQYALPKEQEELPPEIAHLEGVVEPVHIVYTVDNGTQFTEEEENDEE